jgi:hypothetical protein
MGAIGVILIASFAIDRIVTGLFFLLSYSNELQPLVAEDSSGGRPRDDRAAKTRRLIYALTGGYLGTVIIAGILNVRLFAMTKFAVSPDQTPSPLLDTLMTGLILAGGADRLAEALKLFSGGSAPEKKSDHPIEIIGRLVLEQASDATGDKAQTGGMAAKSARV